MKAGACLEVTESYRVCLAGDGTVNKVEVLSGVANADIMASIKETKYKSQGKPRCFVKQLVNVSDESCVKKMVSAASIKEDKISRHDYPQISEALKRKLTDGGGAGGVITGSYKVCVGTDGSVKDVAPIKSIDGSSSTEGEDERIMGMLWRWQFKSQQYEKCFVQIFEYVF